MSAEAVATPNLRLVKRDGNHVVQQRFMITVEGGSTRERSYYVWLDMDSDLLVAVESPQEVQTRQQVEAMNDLRIKL